MSAPDNIAPPRAAEIAELRHQLREARATLRFNEVMAKLYLLEELVRRRSARTS